MQYIQVGETKYRLRFNHGRQVTAVTNGAAIATQHPVPFDTVALLEIIDGEKTVTIPAADGKPARDMPQVLSVHTGRSAPKRGAAFCYEEGRRRALASVLRKAGLPRSHRACIWDAYFSRYERRSSAYQLTLRANCIDVAWVDTYTGDDGSPYLNVVQLGSFHA